MYIQVFIDSTGSKTYPFPFYGPHRVKLLGYDMFHTASTTVTTTAGDPPTSVTLIDILYPKKWVGLVSRALRNPSQITPCLFVFPVSISSSAVITTTTAPGVVVGRSEESNGSSTMGEAGAFECDLNGSVDFQLIDASTLSQITGTSVDKTQMVLSFEVEKIKELSTRHN